MFFTKKKKKRTPMTRNIYLMERNGSSWKWVLGFFFKVREIKIGVAKNSQQRQKQVDNGIKGKVVFLTEYWIEAATRTEKEIHTKYKKFKFKPPVHRKGSGETEFLKISNRQIEEIKSTLSRRSANNSDFKKVFFLFLFLIILFYYFFKFK